MFLASSKFGNKGIWVTSRPCNGKTAKSYRKTSGERADR